MTWMTVALKNRFFTWALAAACVCIPPWGATAAPQGEVQKKIDKKTKTQTQSVEAFEASVKRLVEAYQLKQHESALVNCKQAMTVMPDDTPNTLKTSVMFMCIDLMTKNQQFEEALQLANELKKLPEANLTDICFMEATSLTRLHRWQDARMKYQECPTQGDTKMMAMIESNVAELEMTEGNLEASIKAYASSLEKNPENPHAAFGIAVAYARQEDEKRAQEAFLNGVELDPDFAFLKDAFFEPKAEEIFQKAYRMIGLHRTREAEFYLERYIGMEQRLAYRANAQKWLSKLTQWRAQGQEPRIAQYPVLLNNVRGIAMNDDGSWLAFIAVERDENKEVNTILWTLETETGKTNRRLVMSGIMISDLEFIGATDTLRLLGVRYRYELKLSDPSSGYLQFDNGTETFPIQFASSAREILRLDKDGMLELSAWKDIHVARSSGWLSPVRARRVAIAPDLKSAIYSTTLKTLIVETQTGETIKELPRSLTVEAIDVHPHKNIFALGMQTGTLLVDANGKFLKLLGSPQAEPVSWVAFSPDGTQLAAFSQNVLEIWKIPSDVLESSQNTPNEDASSQHKENIL